MKKIFAGIATILLALAMAAMFVSCGDGKEQQGGGGDGGGGTPETEYSITVEQVSGAQLSADKQKAKNGETVTVTATVTDSEKYIASVTANGEECEESDGKYTFTVGNKDVVVTAELGTYKEIAESDFLCLGYRRKATDRHRPDGYRNARSAFPYNGSFLLFV